MSLMPCPFCGEQVADQKGGKCPKCGGYYTGVTHLEKKRRKKEAKQLRREKEWAAEKAAEKREQEEFDKTAFGRFFLWWDDRWSLYFMIVAGIIGIICGIVYLIYLNATMPEG